MNYRLGAFGWLGGDKYYEEGGQPNLGLLDQAFAMQWIRGYVYLFGGAADREVIFPTLGGACTSD